MNLFEIQNDYRQLASQLIESEGELTEETSLALSINQDQLEQKGIQYGFVIKELESEVNEIDVEIKRLSAMKKSRSNAVDRLKDTLKQAMELYGINELKTVTLKINFRKSESIEILDEAEISSDYKEVKTIESISKTKIKDAIKAGIEVKGAILQQNNNLQIK